MQIDGSWYRCADGVTRPIIRAEVESAPGTLVSCLFLIDTGADFTVLSARVLEVLRTRSRRSSQVVAGVGGIVSSVEVDATIWLMRDGGGRVAFNGTFAAVTDPAALDMSVLGRDIMRFFAVIVDQPGDTVSLINQNHHYSISAR